MGWTRRTNTSKVRLTWVIAAIAVVAATSMLGFFAHGFQKERNTRRLLDAARKAQLDGRYLEAIDNYGLYLDRNSADIEVLRDYTDLLCEQLPTNPRLIRPTVRALRLLNRAEPGDVLTMDRLTRVYMDVREFGLACDLARSWVEQCPTDSSATLALARALHGNNQNDAAFDVLRRASEASPGDARMYPPLVELLDSVLQQPAKAELWLQRGLRYAPHAHETHMAAFLYYENHEEHDSARKHLERAVEIAPDEFDVLIVGARFWIAQQELDYAREWIDRAAKLNADSPGVLGARRALAINSADPQLMIEIGDALSRAGKKGDRTALAEAAELYLRAGSLEKADACMEEWKNAGLPAIAQSTLETLKGARELLANRPYQAIAHLEESMRGQPPDQWTLELLARAFLRTGSNDDAAEAYQRLAMMEPALPGPRLALARLAIQSGRYELAAEHLNTMKSPDTRDLQQAELLRIRLQILRNQSLDLDKVVQELEAMASSAPADAAIVELLVHAFVDADRAGRAVDVWSSWSDRQGAWRDMGLDLSRRLVQFRDFARAKQCVELIRNVDPHCAPAQYMMWQIQLAEGRAVELQRESERTDLPPNDRGVLLEMLAENAATTEEKTRLLREAAGLRTDDLQIRRNLVRELTDDVAALEIVEEMRSIEGERGLQWKWEKASILLRSAEDRARTESALALIRQCLDQRPGWIAAQALMGFGLERLGALPEAVESYRAALALSADPAPEISFRLVGVLKQQGRFAEADSALIPVARALPDSIDVRKLIAEKHIRQKEWAPAASLALEIMADDPDDPSWASLTADLHLRLNQPANAEEIARNALVRSADSVPLVTSLARALLAQQKTEEAVALTKKYSDTESDVAFDVLYARILLEAGRGQEAQDVLDAALAREPANAQLHAWAAEFYSAAGNHDRQIEFVRSAISLRGIDPTESLDLAALLIQGDSMTDWNTAADIIQRRLAAEPADVRALILSAKLAMRQNPSDLDAARAALSAALRVNPRLPAAHKMLAAIQLKRGELLGAEESIAAGLVGSPDDPELLELSAEVRVQRGEFQQALHPLRRLFAQEAASQRAVELLAYASSQTRQFDEAINLIRKMPSLTPQQTIVLARLYEDNNQLELAATLLEDAIADAPGVAMSAYLLFKSRQNDLAAVDQKATRYAASRPDDLISQLTAAQILASQTSDGELRKKGLAWLDQIAASQPDFAADARYRLALIHLQSGDFAKAEQMLKNAASLAPLNPRPVNALAWLYGTELEDAGRGLNELIKFEKSGGTVSVEMLDTYGALLLRLRRFEEAALKLSACLRLAGQSPIRASALFHLSLVQFDTGATQDALMNLKTAMQHHERVGGLNERQLDEAHRRLNSSTSTRS